MAIKLKWLLRPKKVVNNMSKTVQKGTLVLIIILLVVCIGCFFYGKKLKDDNVAEELSHENTNKQFKFDGKLWFYDETGTLLGTYTCQTANCGYAKSHATDKDMEYPIEYPDYTNDTDLPIVNDAFVFLYDSTDTTNPSTILYSIKTSFAIGSFPAVSDYDVGLDHNYFIIKNTDGKYGVISLEDTISYILPVEYDFISLPNNIDSDNKIVSDSFITLKDGQWDIISSSQAVLTKNITGVITNFYGNYLITSSDNTYNLYNYSGVAIFDNSYRYLTFVDKYLLCETMDNEVYLFDMYTRAKVGESYTAKDTEKISGKVNENKVEVYISNRKVESVDINS